MQEKEWVFLNGDFLKSTEAKISVFDRGFIFGDGVYEVLPVIESQMVDKDGFWERLQRSLREIALALPFEQEKFFEILTQLICKNQLKEGGLYVQITRGVASRNFHFVKNIAPTIMAFAFEEQVIAHRHAKTGVKTISVPDIRWKRRDIKSISLLAQCYAKNLAYEAGAYEALMLEEGWVTEGSSSSVFMIKNHTLITKPLSQEILSGVRRKNILAFAHKAGLEIHERAFSLQEAYEADEVFISAASFLLLGVVSIDDRLIQKGKVGFYTNKLRELYIQKLQQEIQRK